MPKTTEPRTGAAPTRLRPSANGTVPPAPPEATTARMRMLLSEAVGRFRMAMTPLRRIVRRPARRA